MRKIILVAVALCSCIVLIGSLAMALTVKAQEEPAPTLISEEEVSASDLGVAEPTLLPTSRLYFLKDWWRGIRTALTFSQEKKAELRLQFASERLIEAKELAKQNKAGAMEKAMEKYGQEIDKIKEIADKIKDNASSSEKVSKFLDKYANQQVLHNEIINKIKENVPADVAEKIEQQREQHLERFGEVMDKLETRKEKVQERIENALQKAEDKIKGFKERRQEILDKIEEKLPEGLRKKIQERTGASSSDADEQWQEEIIGGDKDEHGCISSAGYTWCEIKEKCLRTWEETCEQEQEQEQNQNQGADIQNQNQEQNQNQNQTPGNQQGQSQGQN
ncbi:DUF5667 domain-containing protein [Candidatus Parcubacteria bacterium]|nr:DUF5667 domain-containing protein [Candidatus Parcubacteria bacterium]